MLASSHRLCAAELRRLDCLAQANRTLRIDTAASHGLVMLTRRA